jgi:hypothetical protein
VCKQFYKEALPVFYNINTFYFSGPKALNRALKLIPGSRLQHVRNIMLDFVQSNWEKHLMFQASKLLARMQNQRKVDIRNLYMWTSEDWGARQLLRIVTFDLAELPSFPGFKALAEMRGLEHVRVFDFVAIESYIRPQMRQSRPEPEEPKDGAGSEGTGGKGESEADKAAGKAKPEEAASKPNAKVGIGSASGTRSSERT